jgi:hypothetical protein
MILSLWVRSLKNRLDRRSSTAAYRVSGPGLEALEDRRLPALITWINPLGGDWDKGSNWSSGSVPDLADQAVIALPGITVTHSHSNSDRVGSVLCAGTLDLSAGTLAVSNPSIVNALILSGGTFCGPGALTISTSFLWTQGTLSGGGPVNVQGTLTLAGPGNMVLKGTTLNNQGIGYWTSGNLTATGNAIFNNLEGATFIDAARGTFAATLVNDGTFLVQTSKGTSQIAKILNTGTVDLQENDLSVTQYVQTDGVTDLEGGTLSAARPVQINGGSLLGPGLIKGSLVNGGLVSVVGFGVLGVTGQYVQTSTGILQVAVDAQTSANGFGQLQVSGPATLDGSLNVQWSGSPTTAGQAAFPVVTFTSRTGTFSNLTVTSTTVPPTVTATYSSSALNLAAQITLLPSNSGTSVPSNPVVGGKPVAVPAAPQGSTETLLPTPTANGLFLSSSVGGGGAFLVSGSQSTAFGILEYNREVTLGSVHEPAAFGGRSVASMDDWGGRDDDWQDSLFTLPDDWELPSDKELLVSMDLAGTLLLGAKPRADLLPQKGSEHASVATLLPGEGTGDGSATVRMEEVGRAPLKGLLTNPVASVPDEGELPPLPQGEGTDEAGDLVAYSWGQLVWAGVGWLGWQRRKAKSDHKRKKRRWVALG